MIRRIRTVAAVAALSALVASCQTPGTAATVNGERITDREVAEATAQIAEAFPGQPVNPTDILGSLVFEKIFSDVAEQYDATVSDEELLASFNASAPMSGLKEIDPETAAPSTVAFLRSLYYNQSLMGLPNAAEVTQALGGLIQNAQVEMNPRYGIDFDPEQAAFVPLTHEWIAN